MIHDDPMNHKSKKLNNSVTAGGNNYFPLSFESEEEIVAFQGIEVTSETKIKAKTGNETSDLNSDKGVYYKFALLIGLCKI